MATLPAPLAAWDTVRVHAAWYNYDGTLKAGTYTLTIPTRVTDNANDAIIPAGVFAKGPLNVTAGAPSLDLQVPAFDDPDITPSGVQPILVVTFTDGSTAETYALSPPSSLVGNVNGIDLVSFVYPTSVPTSQPGLVRGVPGGVAALNNAGQVVDSNGATYASASVVSARVGAEAPLVKRAAATGPYLYYRPVTVDNSAGPAKSGGWPVKVALTSSSMSFVNALNDGRDISCRLDDGATVLPHWVASWDTTGQSAEVWVRLPNLPAEVVQIRLYYGNSTAENAFSISDVFPVGADFKDRRQTWSHPALSAQKIIFTADESWESSSGAHTVEVVDFGTPGKQAPDGNVYRFWYYYGHYGSDGIGLAFSNDPLAAPVKWSGNPILDATAHLRWPTVQKDDDGILHLLVSNTSSNDLRRYTLAADGHTATFVEIVGADAGYHMGNSSVFRDPATQDYIYWFFRQRTSDSVQQVCYRRAATIPALTLANTVVVSQSPLVWAAPAMAYFDGLYWLYAEDYDNSGQLWRTVVQSSPTPTGPFTPCSNSLMLTNDQPCARAYVFDDVLYVYNAQRLNQANSPASNWEFGVSYGIPVRGSQRNPGVIAAPNAGQLQSYSKYGAPQVQDDVSVGAGVSRPSVAVFDAINATSNVDKSVLVSAVAPADLILVARVKPMSALNPYFGVRGSVAGARYRFDAGASSSHIDTSTGWHSGGTHIVTGTGSAWTLNTWHLCECEALGSSLKLRVDGTQLASITDATYATSGYCAVETPNGTKMGIDYVYARPYDGVDPTVTVGSETTPGAGAPSRLPVGAQVPIFTWAAPHATSGPWALAGQGGAYTAYVTRNYPATLGDFIEWGLWLPAGRYTLDTAFYQNTDGGQAQVSIDGANVGSVIEVYGAAGAGNAVRQTGIVVPTSGLHLIRYTAVSKNASATSYVLRLAAICLTRTA